VRKTVHKESSQASVRKEKGFRLVEFQNIPLPSTGGQVTGEILDLLHAMPHTAEAKKIEHRIRNFFIGQYLWTKNSIMCHCSSWNQCQNKVRELQAVNVWRKLNWRLI